MVQYTWPTVVCGEGVCECWYDHLSVVLLCVLYSHQDWELNYACVMVDWRMLSQSINKGADPNWKDEVSLQLFNSQCCVYHALSYCATILDYMYTTLPASGTLHHYMFTNNTGHTALRIE